MKEAGGPPWAKATLRLAGGEYPSKIILKQYLGVPNEACGTHSCALACNKRHAPSQPSHAVNNGDRSEGKCKESRFADEEQKVGDFTPVHTRSWQQPQES